MLRRPRCWSSRRISGRPTSRCRYATPDGGAESGAGRAGPGVRRPAVSARRTTPLLLPLPAEPGALHGHDPSCWSSTSCTWSPRTVWEAVTSVAGKRPESLTLAISTPASIPGLRSCGGWWSMAAPVTIRAFYFKEFAAPEGCAADDREAWRIANPALACRDPFLAEDGLEAARKTIREAGVPPAASRAVGDRRRVVAAVGRLGSPAVSSASCSPANGSSWRSTVPRPVTPPRWSAAPWTGICGSKACGRTPAIRAGVCRAKTSPARSMWHSRSTTWSSWRATRGDGARRSRNGPSGTVSAGWSSGTPRTAQRMAPATDRLYQAVATRSRYPRR